MSRMDKGAYTSGVKSKAKVPSKKKLPKKKPFDHPKRPLSAYNFFFKDQRAAIVRAVHEDDKAKKKPEGAKKVEDVAEYKVDLDDETIARLKLEGGKVSFEEIGKLIGQHWKVVDPNRLAKYTEMSKKDGERYKREMFAFTQRHEARIRREHEEASSMGSRTSEGEAPRATYHDLEAPTSTSAFSNVMPLPSYYPYGSAYAMGQQSMYPPQYAQYGTGLRQGMGSAPVSAPARPPQYGYTAAFSSSMYGGSGSRSMGYGYR